MGGIYPVSATVEWALAELVRHPAMLERVQMEMTDVVGPYHIVDQAEFSQLSFFQVSLPGCFEPAIKCIIQYARSLSEFLD